jgi:hypothetical protein
MEVSEDDPEQVRELVGLFLGQSEGSQWTIPKVQACEQFIQAQAYCLDLMTPGISRSP